MKKLPKHLEIILRKQFEIAGHEFNIEGDFFLLEATQEQIEEFKEWMRDYLYNSSEARKQIMKMPAKNKKQINIVVDMFDLNYGFTQKKEK